MSFWTAIAVIALAAIFTEFILRVVKLGTRYSENKRRIENGYPTIDGAQPGHHAGAETFSYEETRQQ